MRLRLLGCACLIFTFIAVQENTTAAQGQQAHTLTVTSDNQLILVSLKAEGASLSAIAADLEKRLRARVFLGPTLQKETISVSFSDSLLEPALMALAPRIFVDYEIRQNAPAVPLGIYLLDFSDPTPASDAVVRGTSQGVVIEGNTEDVAKTPKEDPLLITGDKNFLSITSRKQPLALVARAIGEVLGIPVEVNDDAGELVEVEIRNAPSEAAIPILSPKIRLYIRADINQGGRTPIKLAIESPTAR